MKYLLYVLGGALAISSCNLDSQLYNSTQLEEYQLDDYTESNFEIGDTYDIADSLVHLFSVTSDLDGDLANIYGVYIGDMDRIATDTVILYCHGNARHIDGYWQRAKLLANVGGKNRYGVLIFDYRGYGVSEGTPSEAGLYADTDAMMQWLANNGLTSDRLVIYGFSMGSAPSTELTAHPRTLTPSKLILEAPFASSTAMLEGSSTLGLPGSYITNLEIDNAEEIKEVNQPFLWIHGTIDDFVDFETHGQIVANNYQGTYKVEIPVEGADHGDIPPVMGYEVYNQAILDFITY